MNILNETRWLISYLLFVCMLGFAFSASASGSASNDAKLCDQAIDLAARDSGVPVHVLRAIARTESGVTVNDAFVPWPWTINVAGKGVRFNSEKSAVSYFYEQFGAGARNIDLGCFQINHRWHGKRFSSAEEMMNPKNNAVYAARFLKSLHDEFGNWLSAVGAYHSRNREFAQSYIAKYIPIFEQLVGTTVDRNQSSPSLARHNSFPLLRGTSNVGRRGSLFPKDSGTRSSFVEFEGSRG